MVYAFKDNLRERINIHTNKGTEVGNVKCLTDKSDRLFGVIPSCQGPFLERCNRREKWGVMVYAVWRTLIGNCFSKGMTFLSFTA